MSKPIGGLSYQGTTNALTKNFVELQCSGQFRVATPDGIATAEVFVVCTQCEGRRDVENRR